MKCPNCGSVLERDDHFDPVYSWLGYKDDLAPSADYECDECGFAAHWERGVGLTITHDPRAEADLDGTVRRALRHLLEA